MCDCEKRREQLNSIHPGFGDRVKTIADPIARGLEIGPYDPEGRIMPEMLRPDMKSLVWLAIGAFVVPMVLRMIK